MAQVRVLSGSVNMPRDLSLTVSAQTATVSSVSLTATAARIAFSNNTVVEFGSSSIAASGFPGPDGTVALTVGGSFGNIAQPLRTAFANAGATVGGAAVTGNAARTAVSNGFAGLGNLDPNTITGNSLTFASTNGSFIVDNTTVTLNQFAPILAGLFGGQSVNLATAFATLLSGPDTYTGGAGNDVFIHFGGNDTVDGAGGSDTLMTSIGGSVAGNLAAATVTLGSASVSLRNVESVQFPSGAVAVPAGATDDFAGNTSTRGTISVGGSVTGNIETVGDADWFAASLLAGTEYAIRLRGSGSGNGTLGDPHVYLYNASGTELRNDDDGGGSLDSRLVFTPTASGVYYLAAREHGDNATGTYRLSLETTGATSPPPPMTGGLTRDTFGNVFGTANADLINAASGAVTNGPDTIFGGAGNDTIFGGGSGNNIVMADFLIGDAGDDQLFGEDGDDALFGRTGNDSLVAGEGTDALFGEEGNDTLVGGNGLDLMLGGSGADRFVVLASNTNVADGFFDYIPSEGDRIQITLRPGADPSNPANIPQFIQFSPVHNVDFTFVNVFPLTGFDTTILLAGRHVITAADFVFG